MGLGFLGFFHFPTGKKDRSEGTGTGSGVDMFKGFATARDGGTDLQGFATARRGGTAIQGFATAQIGGTGVSRGCAPGFATAHEGGGTHPGKNSKCPVNLGGAVMLPKQASPPPKPPKGSGFPFVWPNSLILTYSWPIWPPGATLKSLPVGLVELFRQNVLISGLAVIWSHVRVYFSSWLPIPTCRKKN